MKEIINQTSIDLLKKRKRPILNSHPILLFSNSSNWPEKQLKCSFSILPIISIRKKNILFTIIY